MRRTQIDHAIEALAGTQLGAFTRAQAFTLGASERFVARRLADRSWIRQAPAVYALASSPATWMRQCKVAELSIDGGAIAGHAAGVLHGFPGYKPGRIEVVASINAPCRNPKAIVHRYAGAAITQVGRIRVTTPSQTLCDLAMRLDVSRLEPPMDALLLDKKMTLDDLDERLLFYEGSRRPGLHRIRALTAERRVEGWCPPESELESLLGRLLERLPFGRDVVRQATFPWRTEAPQRVDVLVPQYRLIIEADGRRWHTRVADFDRDRWRDNEAIAHGYSTLRFTWVHLHDLADDAVDLVLRTAARAAA